MRNISFEEYDLDNGLHVILHNDDSVPVVAVSVMYHVGSKNETPDRTGFAHFFEHLLFEGTRNIERGDYDKYVEKAGGTLNANTSFDRTYYYEILPSHQLELGLWLESERMLHAKVDEVGINTQRSVVKEEKMQRVDNQPYGTVMEETFKRAFSNHPYRWMPIGSMEHLADASEKDYKEFYETYYVPNNATLCIAGNIDQAQCKAWVDQYFAPIPKGSNVPFPDKNEAPLEGEVRDVVFDKIQLPAVIQAYRIPAQTHADFFALDLMSGILSKGQSSRMYKHIVDEQQLALAVFNFTFALEDHGLNITYGIANSGVEASDLESEMDKVTDRLKTDLISDKEYKKLINQKEADFVNQNAKMAGIAHNLASYHTFYKDANMINSVIEEYRAVSREDIRRVANTYLNKKNRVVLHYLPENQKP